MKKCKYTHCHHNSRDVPDEEAVTPNGTTYYHADCYKEKECIDNILKLWADCVDPSPIFNQLRRIVNNIVFQNGVPAEQLLFCLKWCINNRWNLRNPGGLYYVAKDNDAIAAYKESKKPKITVRQDMFVVNDDMTKVDGFKNKNGKAGFNRILR
jgi:hypothetical protein